MSIGLMSKRTGTRLHVSNRNKSSHKGLKSNKHRLSHREQRRREEQRALKDRLSALIQPFR